VEESLSQPWLDAFCRMSAVDGNKRVALQHILTNIVPSRCFVSLILNGRVLGAGLGVLQAGYIGLFDIVVDADFRSRGYGQQIVESILYWGKQNGAQYSYLQVMLNNPPALRCYAKIGLAETYQYWYQIKEWQSHSSQNII
jgi:GNAT superfamily N-acetyltransferase